MKWKDPGERWRWDKRSSSLAPKPGEGREREGPLRTADSQGGERGRVIG